mmetsp:Transcript_24294/g.46103  ORF Transcript_24294/g.46103 Transcript_24294/m.46103 type:complete len:895 (+) Transcript_24294:145-2829(+)
MYHVYARALAPVALALELLCVMAGVEAQNSHPSELCVATDPNRDQRLVSDEDQLLEAVMDPKVACVLVSQTIFLSNEGNSPESLLFEGKGCVRYGWPFCAHQILTHTVAIAPAPGLLDTEAELHYPKGTLYSTNLEFLGTGRCTLIGMRIFGLLDLEDLGVATAVELDDGGDSSLDLSGVTLGIPLDARHVLGGNGGINDTKVFMHCGPRYELVLQLFALGTVEYSTYDASRGELHFTHTFTEELGSDLYTIDPFSPAKHVEVNVTSISISMNNAIFSCCESMECSGGECVDQTCEASLVDDNQGSVQYKGHEYTLLPKYRSSAQSQEECASSLDAELASFASMAELYEVTKALFVSEDGALLRTLRLTAWVSKEQSRDLDLHWIDPPWIEIHEHHEVEGRPGQDDVVAGVTDCVAVDVISQLLLYQECTKASSFICERKLPESIAQTPLPPPPRRYLSPSNSSSGEGGLPQVALVVMLVAGGLVAAFALMVCYPAWRRTRLGKLFASRHRSSHVDAAARLGSVYLTNSVAEDMMSIEAELEMEGEVVRMPVNRLRTEFEKLLMETTKNTRVTSEHSVSDAHAARGDSSSSHAVYSNSKSPTRPIKFPSIEGYQIIKELGQGTHATCYLAKDGNVELWAIKVPRSDHTTVKVVQEAYFLQLFDHANVVAHKRTIVRHGKIVLVTEFCDKGDVHTLLKRADRPFSERFICHTLLQCAMGLSRMHACNIAHRDVKPANILLKSGALFKLADLGASCMILDTEHTSFTGTPLFMAPEVLAGEAQAVQTDIYSLGCMAYMMCMLKTPYHSETVNGLISSIRNDAYAGIPTHLFSENLIELIRSMLLPRASERPTAEDICNLDWLFQFCCDDFESFSQNGGGFDNEISGRSTTVYDSAQ